MCRAHMQTFVLCPNPFGTAHHAFVRHSSNQALRSFSRIFGVFTFHSKNKSFNYIYSTQSTNMHIGIEQNLKEGTYYLFSDVNYRYANSDKKIGVMLLLVMLKFL